jgi:hypothetical protein
VRSGGGFVCSWEVVIVEGDRSAHHAVTVRGDAITTPARDLGDEAVAAQLLDEPARALAAPEDLSLVEWWTGMEPAGDLLVRKAADRVLAGQDGPEEREVVVVDGVQAGVSSPPVSDGPGVPVQHGGAVTVVERPGQGIEVPLVCGPADLVVAGQVCYALSHRAPHAGSVFDPEHAELNCNPHTFLEPDRSSTWAY